MTCARESAREWSNELGPSTKKGRVSSAGRGEDGACTAQQEKDTRAQQEKGHESKAGEGNSTTRKQNMTNRKGNHD